MEKGLLRCERGVEPLAMKIMAGVILLVIGLGIGYAVYTWAGGYVTAIKCELSFDKSSTTIGKPGSGENSDMIQVTTRYVMGTKETVTLDATGEPSGVRVTFDPQTGEPDFYSNMRVYVNENAAADSYVLTILVKDSKGNTSGSTAFNLEILES